MYEIMFYGGSLLAVIAFIGTTVLFIKDDVAKLIGIVTGYTARRTAGRMRRNKKNRAGVDKKKRKQVCGLFVVFVGCFLSILILEKADFVMAETTESVEMTEEAETVTTEEVTEETSTTELPDDTDETMPPEIKENSLRIFYKENPDKAAFVRKAETVYYLNDTAVIDFEFDEEKGVPVKIHIKTSKDGTELPEFVLDAAEKETDFDVEEEEITEEDGRIKEAVYEEEGSYVVSVWGEDAEGTAGEQKSIAFVIDKTAPVISDIIFSDKEGTISTKYDTIYSNRKILVKFSVTDIAAGVDDSKVFVKLGTENTTQLSYAANRAEGNFYYVYLPAGEDAPEINDILTIWADDCLGNTGFLASVRINNSSSKPLIQMGSAADYSGWTNQSVEFHTQIVDEKCGLKEAVYRVNGKSIKKKIFHELTTSYDFVVTAEESANKESGYTVELEVTNNCNVSNTMKKRVYIDKIKPKISLSGVENSVYYNQNQTVTVNVQDISYQDTKTFYVVTRTIDGKTYDENFPEFCMSKQEDSQTQTFTKEGFYEMYAVAVDGAGNRSRSDTLTFVIDKTAPALSVFGTEEGSMNRDEVALTFQCVESFFDTARVDIKVEKTLDGKKTAVETGNFVTNKKKTVLQHIFAEDGTYRVIMSARDKAGNVAKTQIIHFTVDGTKPEIRITGTNNYELWREPAKLAFLVTESNYAGNCVTVTGTRRDINGKIYELELPVFSNYNKTSVMTGNFSEDGFYEIKAASKDAAGNTAAAIIHFTVDKTPPEIHLVEDYANGHYEEFRMAEHLSDVFCDLTVISYRILLNGIEYNGTDKITAEGKYELYVMAKDELGNVTQKSVEFMVERAGKETPEAMTEPAVGSKRQELERKSLAAVSVIMLVISLAIIVFKNR